MSNPFPNCNQFSTVSTFSELVETHFSGTTNAICWERDLVGNFGELVSKLKLKDDITEITVDDLLDLQLSADGDLARSIILNDLEQLSNCGASPSLNLLKKYERDVEFDFISTDVYSFHVDRSPVATSTFLCTYYGASGDIVANAEAKQKVLIPEVRAKLKALHNSEEDFELFLEENYFDLHYQPLQNANPINLGLGNLWRLAVEHPGQKVLPCIHRAPQENPNEYRLLLIC